MNLHTTKEKGVDDLLKLELSLDASDLLAHAWYHGPLSRPEAEEFLQCDGDFLVRDCSSSAHSGDFVLSCRWQARNLHFIVQRVILQPDTIYEKFGYRFDGEGFDTVPDLITYYVGSEKPISIDSGALISRPKPRQSPVVINPISTAISQRRENVSVSASGVQLVVDKLAPASYKIDTLQRLAPRKREQSLNLEPPPGLLESLTEIPAYISTCSRTNADENESESATLKESSLNIQESFLARSTLCENASAKPLPEAMVASFLEIHERLIALYLTKLDWEILSRNSGDSHLYEACLHDSVHRWTNIIERSLSLSQFVVKTVLHSFDTNPELIFDKWARVAGELKTRLGNFFSFFAVMRGLLMSQLSDGVGKLDWFKLRSEFTESMLVFETAYRMSYQNLVKGVEPYSPNLTIPELSVPALILEDATDLDLTSMSGTSTTTTAPISQEGQMQFVMDHLNTLRAARQWEKAQAANMARNLSELNSAEVPLGLGLAEMFRISVQSLTWRQYNV